MKLQLTRNDPARTTLVNLDGNVPQFRITTPGFLRKTSTIYKISPEAAEEHKEELLRGDDDFILKKDTNSDPLEVMVSGVEERARIHWHRLTGSRLIYNGRILEIKSFLPKKGFLKRARTFTGPDGLSYRWVWGVTSYLEVDDETKPAKEIAKFRQGNILKGVKPYLEIHEGGLHMVELIVITWVFVETRRREDDNQVV